MSIYEMVVVSFDEKEKASEVLSTLKQLEDQEIIDLKSAAIVIRETSGNVNINETNDFDAKKGAITGALAGGVLGLLTGRMIGGALLGAGGGVLASTVVDLGIDDDFLKRIGDNIKPGSSAIIAMVDFAHIDRAMKELDKFEGGKILRHNLSDEVYKKLSEAVED